MKSKSPSHRTDPLYAELFEEDNKYGGRKLERPESNMRRDRRP